MGESIPTPVRLLASAACIAAAAVLACYSFHEIELWGWGLYPGLCLLTALTLALVGIALTCREARDSVVEFVWALLEALAGLL